MAGRKDASIPEGDTILRTAKRLKAVLRGQRLLKARSQADRVDVQALVGSESSDVEARGKHLLIHFENQLTLHSHLGMTGSWHVYAPHENWQKPEHRAAVILETSQHAVVCFSPKWIEVLTLIQLRRHRYLNRLGPDILADRFDLDQVLERLARFEQVPIGEALMNQTISCGIGNVYKSETLFLSRINPFCHVIALGIDQRAGVFARARDLMQRNLNGHPRTTRPRFDGGRLWVYGRQHKPCYCCGTHISMQRQGDLGRSTYWCPHCQPAPDALSPAPLRRDLRVPHA